MPTAILVDAAFFLKRLPTLWPLHNKFDPQLVSRTLYDAALKHLTQKIAGRVVRRDLYRVFVYDCPPLEKKAHQPVTNRSIDFGKSEQAKFRRSLHVELVKLRKVALRLGRLSDNSGWVLHKAAAKDIVSGKRAVSDLKDGDFIYDFKQKGVDIRIGIDICSLTLKHQVDQIVLISGDADFVPAAKLARREGIDFVLDPMWSHIGVDLTEHIDGLRTTAPKPSKVDPVIADVIDAADEPDSAPA